MADLYAESPQVGPPGLNRAALCRAGPAPRSGRILGCSCRIARGTWRKDGLDRTSVRVYYREDREITRHQDQANCRRDDGRERRAKNPSTKIPKKVHPRYQKGTPLAGKLSPYSMHSHYVRSSRYALWLGELVFLCVYVELVI